MMTVEISAVISLCSLIIAFATLLGTRKRDTSGQAAREARLEADVNYIRTSIDEIKIENRTLRNDVRNIELRLAKLETEYSDLVNGSD